MVAADERPASSTAAGAVSGVPLSNGARAMRFLRSTSNHNGPYAGQNDRLAP
jgi:hypothetical protein